MFKQNYGMELLLKSGNVQQASMDFNKSEKSEINGFPEFKSILGSTMEKAQRRTSGSDRPQSYRDIQKNERSYNSIETNSNPKSQFKAYREVRNAVMRDTAAERQENNVRATSEVSSKEENGMNDIKKTKEDAVIAGLAEVLGISANELVKLLESAGVKPEELTNQTKAEETINKLAASLNLSDSQKGALSEVLNVLRSMTQNYPSREHEAGLMGLGTEVQNQMKNSPLEDDESKNGWVKINNSNITVVDYTDPEKAFNELMAKMKIKLGDLAEKLEKSPLEFKQDIAESLKPSLTQLVEGQDAVSGLDKGAANSLNGFESGEVSANGTESELKTSNETRQESNSESDSQSDEGKSMIANTQTTDSKLIQQGNAAESNEMGIQFNNAVEAQGSKASVHEATKFTKEMNMPKSEIIEQVVNKAKVILTPDKSEMVMELKPESLGKLSLKVVTENGIVMAKFIAENQQVKEVLETNMQLLKDSLEKQGLSVQGFSVSVRQDSNGRNGNGFENAEKDGKTNVNIVNGINISREIDLERIQRSNPYAWSDSQINLTA